MTTYFPDRWVSTSPTSCVIISNIGDIELSALRHREGRDLFEYIFHHIIKSRINPLALFRIEEVQIAHLNIRPEWGRDFKTKSGDFPRFDIGIKIGLSLSEVRDWDNSFKD